jgi:hypothetical protein
MASLSKRMSASSIHASRRSASPISTRFVTAMNAESDEWIRAWENTTAHGMWDHPFETGGLTPAFNEQPWSKAL